MLLRAFAFFGSANSLDNLLRLRGGTLIAGTLLPDLEWEMRGWSGLKVIGSWEKVPTLL